MSVNVDDKQWLSALLKTSQETTVRTLDANGGRPDCSHGGVAVVAITQNQRDEVRDSGDIAGALSDRAGIMHQTCALLTA